jgi:hypothetical protein
VVSLSLPANKELPICPGKSAWWLRAKGLGPITGSLISITYFEKKKKKKFPSASADLRQPLACLSAAREEVRRGAAVYHLF